MKDLLKQVLKIESELKLKFNKLKSLTQLNIQQLSEKLNTNTRLLDANSYEKILDRGFSITYNLENKIIKRKEQTRSNQKFKVIYKDGEKHAIFD